ncbi:hypothetical protein Tco_0802421 [Tanacetum coccineum]|uniref:Integrase, catalytic region, zinc finger, CCHC-type, peptidase aspartic, catalytic n=1 Tax=Tanacetum coccineum TaxID=301880 RepID=A0ABQ5A314_9ASTR
MLARSRKSTIHISNGLRKQFSAAEGSSETTTKWDASRMHVKCGKRIERLMIEKGSRAEDCLYHTRLYDHSEATPRLKSMRYDEDSTYANPLALVASITTSLPSSKPSYSKHSISSTRSQQSTRNRGKKQFVTSSVRLMIQKPATDTEDENWELEYDNQRAINVVGARENVETWEKCEHLEKELSKSRTMSKNFESLQKHAINLELDLQHSQLQTTGIAISELKKLIDKMKGKSVKLRVIPKYSVSRLQLEGCNHLEDRVMSNNSQGKKQKVEDHRRKFKFSNNKTSITACNDSLNAKTSNVNFKFNWDTVKFGNDQIAPILGFGDLVQGAITIKRVYYVEGLNHNLFSVGQFCDADLEVAFRKSSCYIRDLKGNDLLTGETMVSFKLIRQNVLSINYHPSAQRWEKDHPLEQVIEIRLNQSRTSRQLETDG